MTKKAGQVCPKCTSGDLMERKGILKKHHDHVCLNCGHIIKDTNIEVFELDLVPMREKKT